MPRGRRREVKKRHFDRSGVAWRAVSAQRWALLPFKPRWAKPWRCTLCHEGGQTTRATPTALTCFDPFGCLPQSHPKSIGATQHERSSPATAFACTASGPPSAPPRRGRCRASMPDPCGAPRCSRAPGSLLRTSSTPSTPAENQPEQGTHITPIAQNQVICNVWLKTARAAPKGEWELFGRHENENGPENERETDRSCWLKNAATAHRATTIAATTAGRNKSDWFHPAVCRQSSKRQGGSGYNSGT